MSKAAITLQSTSAISKLDTTDYARVQWRAAYRQARAMIRDRAGHGIGAAYVWCLDHMRRRFGASGWTVAQAAGRLALERRTPGHAASGRLADLHRQGLVTAAGHPTRCIHVERMTGWRMAWSADPLASVNGNRMLRGLRARQLREDRVRRRAVGREMAAERRRILAEVEADDRLYVLTEAGLEALREAGMLD
jgi:hypothetical protein